MQQLKQAWRPGPQLLYKGGHLSQATLTNPLTTSTVTWMLISPAWDTTVCTPLRQAQETHANTHTWTHAHTALNLICHNNRGIMTWWIQLFFSPLLSPVLPLSGNLDAVCNVCCSRRLKLNEWYNQRCWDYCGQNWCYLSNDVLFCGSEATNRREKWSQLSVWFYSLSGERQIE